jgi:hypothetical protein
VLHSGSFANKRGRPESRPQTKQRKEKMKITGINYKKISRALSVLETHDNYTEDDVRLQSRIDGFNKHHNSEKIIDIINHLRDFSLPTMNGIEIADKIESMLNNALNEQRDTTLNKVTDVIQEEIPVIASTVVVAPIQQEQPKHPTVFITIQPQKQPPYGKRLPTLGKRVSIEKQQPSFEF